MSCSWRRVGFPLIWMDDPCSFTSCCQVLDSSSQPWIPSGQSKDFGWSDLLCVHLGVINRAWFEKREKVNEYFCFQLSHTGLLYSRMALTHLIRKHKMWFGALLGCDQTKESIQMGQFHQWHTWHFNGCVEEVKKIFFFWCNTTVKEKKVKCVRSTFWATVALSKPADLSAFNACAPQRGGGVKTNGWHQL